MRFTGRFAGPLPPGVVWARATEPSSEWIDAEVRPAPGGWWLAFPGPIPLSIRVQLTGEEDGVQVQLVEGDLAGVSGRLRLEPDGDGTIADVELDLTFPGSVPGTLLRELDQRVFPRWFRSLVGQAADEPER